MESILDPQKFFRLNRQMMVSLTAIKQFKPETAGRLTVELHPKNSTLALVSKKKATEFKEWLNTKR
jgi:DNA-binding LytR/AlgR family response regulator